MLKAIQKIDENGDYVEVDADTWDAITLHKRILKLENDKKALKMAIRIIRRCENNNDKR